MSKKKGTLTSRIEAGSLELTTTPEADVADPIRELVEYTHSWMFGGTNPKEKAPWSDVRCYYSRHE